MRYLLLSFSILIFSACSIAQPHSGSGYSTKSKKAIKYFEAGKQAPSLSIDPSNNLPNFREGIEWMNKAIDKDPNFWEAHMFAGEFAEMLHDYPLAIEHYKKAIAINPNHSATGSTYFYLANMQHAVGDYDDAIKNIDIYQQYRNASPQLLHEAAKIRADAVFAKNALANPLNFNPINIGPGINTENPEYFPTITVDGKTILFTRRIKDARVKGQIKEQEDFFVSQLGNSNIWGTAVPMPKNVNTVNNEGAPTISADGRSLVFVGCPDYTGENYGENREGKGSCDLFITKKIGSRWMNPKNLPGNVNSYHWETQPSLSSDGKTMYFIRGIRGRDRENDSDIYVTHLQEDGTWGTPERLPDNINTPDQEESVLIHPDGKTLYFASKGHVGMGGSDLYISRMDANGNWGNPVNLGYPINTSFDENSLMVSPDGEVAFFASDREGGYGGLDIYYFDMPLEFRPTKTLYFDGYVYDIETRKAVPGKFELIDIETGEVIIYSEADRLTGEFMVSLPVDKEYVLNVTYTGYTFFSQNFNMTNSDNLEAIHMDIPLVPLSSTKPILLANVFFDLSKSTLRPNSYVELDKLVEFLTENDEISIEIGGHTDSRGDVIFNNQLSENRAESVYDYLIAKGIATSRLTYKGYGSTQPINNDEAIAKMTSQKEIEAAHQNNRRTEYKIIAK